MSNRSEKTARKILIAAFVLVIVLVLAGTLLRMHTREMRFFEAMGSFLSDTFNA